MRSLHCPSSIRFSGGSEPGFSSFDCVPPFVEKQALFVVKIPCRAGSGFTPWSGLGKFGKVAVLMNAKLFSEATMNDPISPLVLAAAVSSVFFGNLSARAIEAMRRKERAGEPIPSPGFAGRPRISQKRNASNGVAEPPQDGFPMDMELK